MVRSIEECPRCGSEDLHESPMAEDDIARAKGLSLRRCNRCAQVFLMGWQDEFIGELYDYYRERLGLPAAEVYGDLNTARQRQLLDALRPQAPGNRLLDVGCGAGQLVHTALAEGWDARGIDLSESAVALGTRLGARVQVLDFFDEQLTTSRFDVIVMSEFIEHVPRPVTFFKRAAQLLEPGGLLYVTTPNFDSLTRRLTGWDWAPIHREHILYFTSSVLEATAREAGLLTRDLTTRNTSVGAIIKAVKRFGQRLPRPGARVAPGGPALNDPDTRKVVRNVDQGLRQRLQTSPLLKVAKRAADGMLSATKSGDTLIGLFRRPRHDESHAST